MSDIDADLVQRTMAGDRAAFEALVITHLLRARAVARSVLGSDPATDDVVQEAFIRAYDRLGQLGEPATFPSWLSTIVRNEAISWLRRHQRGRTVAFDASTDQGLAAPDAQAENPHLEPMRVALGKLSPAYREIIALKYEASLNYDQIAETLGLSVANVEKRLYRARQALLDLMPDVR